MNLSLSPLHYEAPEDGSFGLTLPENSISRGRGHDSFYSFIW